MLVRMSYGRRDLEVDVPDGNLAGILRMSKIKPLENPSEAVRRALDEPIACEPLGRLAQGVGAGSTSAHVCIVVSDITRPVPSKILLPPMLDVLEKHGIHRENIG